MVRPGSVSSWEKVWRLSSLLYKLTIQTTRRRICNIIWRVLDLRLAGTWVRLVRFGTTIHSEMVLEKFGIFNPEEQYVGDETYFLKGIQKVRPRSMTRTAVTMILMQPYLYRYTFWEGNAALNWGDGLQLNIPASKFRQLCTERVGWCWPIPPPTMVLLL